MVLREIWQPDFQPGEVFIYIYRNPETKSECELGLQAMYLIPPGKALVGTQSDGATETSMDIRVHSSYVGCSTLLGK